MLGYSAEGLAEANMRAIEFLREMAREYRDSLLVQPAPCE